MVRDFQAYKIRPVQTGTVTNLLQLRLLFLRRAVRNNGWGAAQPECHLRLRNSKLLRARVWVHSHRPYSTVSSFVQFAYIHPEKQLRFSNSLLRKFIAVLVSSTSHPLISAWLSGHVKKLLHTFEYKLFFNYAFRRYSLCIE